MENRPKKVQIPRTILFWGAAMLCAAMAAASAWGLDMNPGKYEVTVNMEMKGMPAAMPAQTMVQCITAQDPVPRASADAQSCQITDMDTRGNTVTYTIVCHQQGAKTESTGEVTFSGDAFEGTSTTKMGPAAGGMTVTVKTKGKRIGSCP